ncbi:MAG: translocation/assembly module TamB domain-containing protein, partial [Bacteroidaceae bacterium]|nr:translocation/assembly module TamB domain-containing protein [Bacteroidaceae bacterium]
VTGMLNGDIHAVKEEEQATVSVDMDVKKMGFEGSPLGDIGMEMIYFPNADGSHLVDGILSQNNREIALLSGKYWTQDEEGQIEAEANLLRLPLNIANGFITDNMARLEGYISGTLDVQGPVSAPLMSGSIATDSMHICSDPYSIDLRLPDDEIVIKKNFLDLDKIQAYANGDNPLTLDGTIDFTDLSKAKLDLNVVARDFNLINAPKRKGAEAYGKVYVDLFGRMRGTLDNLDIRGRLNINGKTNVTYVMKDSPLVVDDQLNSLVTFTDFSDTTETKPIALPEQNVKMDFQVNIDEATTIHCLMSEDGQDNIELEGGGELRMTYDMLSGLKLFGRYTVLSGSMDYSLVVVSLKNFMIDSGSYVEFMGDMMNPKLNISASERKKASVSNNNVTRTVNFDVGLKITQTLSDLGLEFTLQAPEDLTVQNELASMSIEDRGRAAVAMLTTGMYLSPNSGSGEGFDATSALSSFLNSQISNIAGKALSTIDIGFGIDNTTSATGAAQTDYNFSFAKRFWGNRISVIIGGKVSSGNDAQNTGMSIINNVSVEYRLDNSGTRYVKAFYNKDTESILDSEVMEMGASLVLRRKTENLGELFIFRDTKKNAKRKTER